MDSDLRTKQLDDPARWVDRYGDVLLRFALARVGRPDVAEDLVQETFLAAWRTRDSFDGRSSLGTWLASILRHKLADHYRRRARQRAVGEDAAHETPSLFDSSGKWIERFASWRSSPEQLAQNTEFWSVMSECLDDLPWHLSEAFRLREIRRATVDEACQATGVTPKNLSVRLHRARLLLRRCLDQKWFGSGG